MMMVAIFIQLILALRYILHCHLILYCYLIALRVSDLAL